MPFDFKQNHMRKLAIARRDAKAVLKKKWNTSGDADSALDQLHEKYTKDRPNPSDLPF